MRMVSRTSPVLNQRVEFVVEGTAIKRGDLVLEVEIFKHRIVRKPVFKGRVRVPLKQVIEHGRIADTWPMEGVPKGTLTMELVWRGAMDRYRSGGSSKDT